MRGPISGVVRAQLALVSREIAMSLALAKSYQNSLLVACKTNLKTTIWEFVYFLGFYLNVIILYNIVYNIYYIKYII